MEKPSEREGWRVKDTIVISSCATWCRPQAIRASSRAPFSSSVIGEGRVPDAPFCTACLSRLADYTPLCDRQSYARKIDRDIP